MKTLMWPRQIPHQVRKPAAPGPKCFAIWRPANTPLFHRQRIRLTGNLLILALQGSVALEREGQRVVVDQGGAGFASPGGFQITEIPDRVGRFQSHLTFFNRPVVKQILYSHKPLAEFTAKQPRHLLFTGIYPLHGADTEHLCFSVMSRGAFPESLSDVLHTFMSTSASAFMFLQAALDLPTEGADDDADEAGRGQ